MDVIFTLLFFQVWNSISPEVRTPELVHQVTTDIYLEKNYLIQGWQQLARVLQEIEDRTKDL